MPTMVASTSALDHYADEWYDSESSAPSIFLKGAGRMLSEKAIVAGLSRAGQCFDACSGQFKSQETAERPGGGAAQSANVRHVVERLWCTSSSAAADGTEGGAIDTAGAAGTGDSASSSADDASLLRMRLLAECAYNGAGDMAGVCAVNYGAYDYLDGANIPPPKGFSSVLNALAEPVLAAGCVRLGHTVVAIRGLQPHDTSGAASSSSSSSSGAGAGAAAHRLEVECDNGAVFRARVVICTVSLAVLQHWVERDAIFLPSPRAVLPPAKLAALERLRLGRVEKVHVEYPTEAGCWWRKLGVRALNSCSCSIEELTTPRPADAPLPPCGKKHRYCGSLVFLDPPSAAGSLAHTDAAAVSSEATGVAGGAGSAAETATAGPFPGYQSWMGTLFGAYEDRDPIPVTTPRLTFWLLKDAADAVDPPRLDPHKPQTALHDDAPGPARMPDDELAAALTAFLRHYLQRRSSLAALAAAATSAAAVFETGSTAAVDAASTSRGSGTASNSAGGDSDPLDVSLEDVPAPCRIIRTGWGSNPLTLGSYSYIPCGASVEDIRALAAPLIVRPPALAPPVRATSELRPAGTVGSTADAALEPARVSTHAAAAAPHPTTDTASDATIAAAPSLASAAAEGCAALLFAGEATHQRFFSTTHGAFESGLREAANAAAILGLPF